ncbi:MAG: hypothetical protein HQL37_05145 [Alphaproteobacteria bacterium]|nr:hypothetical protein [Alphaproteobacteria bacterium]
MLLGRAFRKSSWGVARIRNRTEIVIEIKTTGAIIMKIDQFYARLGIVNCIGFTFSSQMALIVDKGIPYTLPSGELVKQRMYLLDNTSSLMISVVIIVIFMVFGRIRTRSKMSNYGLVTIPIVLIAVLYVVNVILMTPTNIHDFFGNLKMLAIHAGQSENGITYLLLSTFSIIIHYSSHLPNDKSLERLRYSRAIPYISEYTKFWRTITIGLLLGFAGVLYAGYQLAIDGIHHVKEYSGAAEFERLQIFTICQYAIFTINFFILIISKTYGNMTYCMKKLDRYS